MSTAAMFPESYDTTNKIIPCPAWTGTYNSSLYQSTNDAVPAIRGGSRHLVLRRTKRNSRSSRNNKRKTRGQRGGFIPRMQVQKPKRSSKRVKRGVPRPSPTKLTPLTNSRSINM